MSEIKKTNDLKVIVLSSAGSILEAYDFVIYLLVAPIMSVKFYIGTETQKLVWIYLVLAIGYAARPIGGLLFGYMGDKYGRKSIFLSSILMMSVATCAIGIIPEYGRIGIMAPALLIVCRLVQGIALGGEIPGAFVFIYEHISQRRKFLGISSILAGIYIGVLLASVVYAIVKNSMDESRLLLMGWKIPFLFGGIIGCVCYLLMAISTIETPVFIKLKNESQVVKNPIRMIFSRYIIAFLLGFVLIISVDNIVTFFFSLFPGFLYQVHSYKFADTYLINITNVSLFILIMIIVGFIRKNLYRGIFRYVLFYIAIAGVSSFILYYVKLHSINLIIVSSALLSIVSAMMLPEITIISAELFPPNVRYSGVAATFNFANAFIGGFTPVAITWLTYRFDTVFAPSCFMISMSIIGIISILLISLYKKKQGCLTNEIEPMPVPAVPEAK